MCIRDRCWWSPFQQTEVGGCVGRQSRGRKGSQMLYVEGEVPRWYEFCVWLERSRTLSFLTRFCFNEGSCCIGIGASERKKICRLLVNLIVLKEWARHIDCTYLQKWIENLCIQSFLPCTYLGHSSFLSLVECKLLLGRSKMYKDTCLVSMEYPTYRWDSDVIIHVL